MTAGQALHNRESSRGRCADDPKYPVLGPLFSGRRLVFRAFTCARAEWLQAVLLGIFTSFAGSGVDICVFSVNTLLFRVSEKTATPTTVVMMGLNSMVGMYCRAVWYTNVSELTFEYLKVTIPVAVTMAPFGSFLGSHFHRQVLACSVYVLEALSVVGFLITSPPLQLILIGAAIILIAFVFFYFISRVGEKIMLSLEVNLRYVK
ncbi:unnamed protein product [Heligmosomoides polygyrus]|uniref:MFS domain-containing protein n=1 Tax=Heligmosomoides polygyrus TaxID=6339 RepID=A0A183G3F3_HELPZ|nr:unnamed protein product [Heligmosomoides polygyrus]